MVSKKLAEIITGINAGTQTSDPGKKYLKQLIMDAIACAVAGMDGPFASEMSGLYSSFGSEPQATVITTGKKHSVIAAAMINTFCARVHTFDDVYEAGVAHMGAPIIMSSLAMGEWLGSKIEDILSAIVAGYEAASDCSYAINPMHYSAGFHPTGTCNVIGVAAAAARIMNLNVEKATMALRLAADMACGYRQYQIDGNIVNSAYHASKAAENGIEAALLARGGFAEPGETISGKFGLFKNMAGKYKEDAIFDNLGKKPRYMETSLKPYPSCRYMHGGVDAAVKCISKNNISKDNIKKITIKTFEMAKEEGDRKELGGILDAQFSLQYNIGGYLINNGLGLAHFTEKAIRHPEYSAWAEKIVIEVDEKLNSQYPEKWPYEAVIETKSGESFSWLSSYPPGAPENPIEDAELQRKWELLMEPVIGAQKSNNLFALVKNIESLKSVSEIWGNIKK